MAINKALPIIESEYEDYMGRFAEVSKTFGINLLYSDVHFAIGAAGPIGAAIELGLGLGNLVGISQSSEYAVRTCCAASFADAMASNWNLSVRNNPIAYDRHGNIKWYAEKRLSARYLSYESINNTYWYIVKTRMLANDDFKQVQRSGLPNLSWIINKGNYEMAIQNEEWLKYEYLENNNLLLM